MGCRRLSVVTGLQSKNALQRTLNAQAIAAANTLAQRMADERLVTAVLEHMLHLRTAKAARCSAGTVHALAPCLGASSASATGQPSHPASADAIARHENRQTAGCASVAAATTDSEENRAAAHRSARLRAAQAVRRQLLLSAACAAAQSAGHVAATVSVSKLYPLPAAEAPVRSVVTARCAAVGQDTMANAVTPHHAAEGQKHCQPSSHQDNAAGSGGEQRSCTEVAQPRVAALQHCMPACPPCKPGRRSSVWAPARM